MHAVGHIIAGLVAVVVASGLWRRRVWAVTFARPQAVFEWRALCRSRRRALPAEVMTAVIPSVTHMGESQDTCRR